jgi:hypothetical protein
MAKYTGESWLGGNDIAYCVMFVSYVFIALCNQEEPFLPSYNCNDVVARARKSGNLVNIDDARTGDLLIFDWGDGGILDHIAILEKKSGADEYQTIEGNTDGGKVARRTRYRRDVRYVVRPNYSSSTSGSHTLEIDGWWGSRTTRAIQRALGLKETGEILSQDVYRLHQLKACTSGWKFSDHPNGDKTISKLQEFLGVTIDGIMGPETIGKLEMWVGYAPDGMLDGPSPTVMRLQSYLNSGGKLS